MKYIDVGLSAINRALLDAWIDRRMSGRVYPDARTEKDRCWWNMLQIRRRMKSGPPGEWSPVRQYYDDVRKTMRATLNSAMRDTHPHASLQRYFSDTYGEN
jgi:hypothetical protein